MGTDPVTLSPRALAFLGDAVYELKLRELALALGHDRVEDLHRFTTERACATFQVTLLDQLALTETEQELVRRARNAAVSVGRRNQQGLHRLATGFEALIGYWHLTQPDRLHQVWVLLADPL
jgi:ribonuclease-3 family protein